LIVFSEPGTVIPQIKFSSLPGGSNSAYKGGNFRMRYIGSGVSSGPWQ
jgi:hypothetical protein